MLWDVILLETSMSHGMSNVGIPNVQVCTVHLLTVSLRLDRVGPSGSAHALTLHNGCFHSPRSQKGRQQSLRGPSMHPLRSRRHSSSYCTADGPHCAARIPLRFVHANATRARTPRAVWPNNKQQCRAAQAHSSPTTQCARRPGPPQFMPLCMPATPEAGPSVLHFRCIRS